MGFGYSMRFFIIIFFSLRVFNAYGRTICCTFFAKYSTHTCTCFLYSYMYVYLIEISVQNNTFTISILFCFCSVYNTSVYRPRVRAANRKYCMFVFETFNLDYIYLTFPCPFPSNFLDPNYNWSYLILHNQILVMRVSLKQLFAKKWHS